MLQLIFGDHWISVAYISFHTWLYFEHRVFLALDKVFCYYNKDTQRNQNKVINKINIVFPFTCQWKIKEK